MEFEKRERAGVDEKSGNFFSPWLGDRLCESFKTAKTTSSARANFRLIAEKKGHRPASYFLFFFNGPVIFLELKGCRFSESSTFV